MIELINVSKYYPTEFGRHYIFRNVSLKLPLDKNVGVLGPNGAGKSTFLRLLGGADAPSEGRIIKTGSISPPMGLTPGLQATLTASENMRFAGRIYGLSREEINETIEFVRNLTGIGKYFDLPVGTYSSGMKNRVAFAINISLSFDYYLFDEISAGGDKEFRKITSQMVEQRLKTSKFIVASHRIEELLELCETGIIIQNGELTYYDDIKDAVLAYGDTEALEKSKTKGPKSQRRKKRAEDAGVAEPATPKVLSPEELQAKTELRNERRNERRKAARLEKQHEAKAAAAALAAQSGETAVPAPQTPDASAEAATGDAKPPRQPRRRRRASPQPQSAVAAEGTDETPRADAGAQAPAPKSRGELIRAAQAERRLAKELALLENAKAKAAVAESAAVSLHPAGDMADEKPDTGDAAQAGKRRRRRRTRAGNEAANEIPAIPAQERAAAPDLQPEADASHDVKDAPGNRRHKSEARAERKARRRKAKDANATPPETPSPELEAEASAVSAGESVPAEAETIPETPAPDDSAWVQSRAERREKRAKRRAATSPDNIPAAAPEAAPDVIEEQSAVAYRPAGAKRLHRALVRQERAREKSTEAIDLLLQYLDRQHTDDDAGAAATVTAQVVEAQERAALEAARARAALEESLDVAGLRPRRDKLAAGEAGAFPVDIPFRIPDPAERQDLTQ